MGWLDNWATDDGVELVVPRSGVIDLSEATVFCDGENRRHRCYAEILIAEVEKRCRLRWQLIPKLNQGGTTLESTVAIKVVNDDQLQSWLGSEGYEIELSEHEIIISGATDRSILFGIGRFLRELYLDFNISYSKPLQSVCYISTKHKKIISTPSYRMRQHQVAYRPKTNSYDAFTPDMMRREILDLALFGCNGIEVIPPGIDDAMQSPQFSVDWIEMLKIVSEWCDTLDINLSIWYPLYFEYKTEEGMLKSTEHWKTVFRALARLDVLFVPGGDPGGRQAAEFFRIVEIQAKFLRENFFPQCEVWVSSQYGLSVSYDLGTDVWVPLKEELQWMQELDTPKVRSFLDGVVYGPWSAHPIDEFRALVPSHFPLRNYPDLCHVQTAELPVYGWDLSFATTNNRESINPRPKEMMRIIEEQAPYTIGCGCYSEGVNDDVNKYVWTALHWGHDVKGVNANSSSDLQLFTALKQYSGFLMEQCRNAEILVEVIFGLERNWKGSALTNDSISETMKKFLSIDHTISPRHRKNWRYNMLQFRAYHDFFVRVRLIQEVQNENKALAILHEHISDMLQPEVLKQVLQSLAVPYEEPAMTISSFKSPSNPDALNIVKLHETPTVTHLYGRLMALAALLFQQIGYQLSVGFGGQHRQRGAYMDLIWAPLGDVLYLHHVFACLLSAEKMSPRDVSLKNRLLTSIRERNQLSNTRVLWYCSFGDNNANEIPGLLAEPTRTLPVESVLPPYRLLELGEDPYFFTRPLIEYLDCSNDEVLRDLHNGLIPRAWRSYLVPIWPRTAKFNLHFNLKKLGLNGNNAYVRITYLGKDLNRHGGDWEELNREAMPVAMKANGFQIHDYLEPPEVTETRQYLIPQEALKRAWEVNNLILSFVPRWVDKVTFVYVPIPIAELWILEDQTINKSKL